MDLSETDPQILKQEEQDQEEENSLLPCKYCDTEIIHKLEQLLLHGLATTCVDRTTGDLFKGPTSVSSDISKEMLDYLIEKTESVLSESTDDDNFDRIQKASSYPIEFISDLIENFNSSKRNLFSRMSNWLSSESRDTRIDDVANQLTEINNFRSISEVLLRNIDIKGNFHCPENFENSKKLDLHRENCDFRPVCCSNEGCGAVLSSIRMEKHDYVCPFRVLPCEQECGERVMRCEMETHCNTFCTMRLVNCPFYQVGCESAFPYCSLEKHCTEFVQPHLFCVLRSVHKQGNYTEELQNRVQLLEKSQSLNEMSGALDLRTLTLLLKEQEAKTKKLESLLKEQEAKVKKLERELSKVGKG